jgi:hypothetical protein
MREDMNSVEFRGNSEDFRRRTLRRMVAELLLLILAAFVFLSKWPADLPIWVTVSAFTLAGGGFLIDILHYRGGRALAESFVIQFCSDSLAFTDLKGTRTVRYQDMKILGTRKHVGEIVEITLQTFPGINVNLRGLNDMNRLYERLSEQLDNSR